MITSLLVVIIMLSMFGVYYLIRKKGDEIKNYQNAGIMFFAIVIIATIIISDVTQMSLDQNPLKRGYANSTILVNVLDRR